MNAIMSVKYEGSLFDNHTIRVSDLAISSLAFERLSNEIAKEFFGKDAKVILYAQTPKEGCWWQEFLVQVVQGTAIKQLDLFVQHNSNFSFELLNTIKTLFLTYIVLTKAWTPEHIEQFRLLLQNNNIPTTEQDIKKLQELAQKPYIRKIIYEQILPYYNTDDPNNRLTLATPTVAFPPIDNNQIQQGLKELNTVDEIKEIHDYPNIEAIPQGVSLDGTTDDWRIKFENEFEEELSVKIKIQDTKFLSFIREEAPPLDAKMKLKVDLRLEQVKRLNTRDSKNWYITKVLSLTKNGEKIYPLND
jgi:hypothetical protein